MNIFEWTSGRGFHLLLQDKEEKFTLLLMGLFIRQRMNVKGFTHEVLNVLCCLHRGTFYLESIKTKGIGRKLNFIRRILSLMKHIYEHLEHIFFCHSGTTVGLCAYCYCRIWLRRACE